MKKTRLNVPSNGTLGVGFIGFGHFAGGVLLPSFKSVEGIRLTGVATRKSVSAQSAAATGGFAYATTDYTQVLNDPQTDIVVIATTNNLHAEQACQALAAGKAVFLEKPLALNDQELARVVQAVREYGGLVQVGFNRRFSPALTQIKEALAQRRTPLSIDYRVCISRPPSPQHHWITDPEIGGGLLIGEVCHFIDAAIFLTDAHPRTVFSRPLGIDGGDGATALFMEMTDGSIVSIRYLTHAAPRTPKEYIDIVGGGITAYVDDFRSYGWVGSGRPVRRQSTQNKGHVEQLKAYIDSLRQKGIAAGDFIAAVYATQATFAARESVRTGRPVDVSINL